jgi:hypothetical protein
LNDAAFFIKVVNRKKSKLKQGSVKV